VGAIDLLLDPLGVKVAVGKAVEGHDLEPVRLERLAKASARVGRGEQLARAPAAQPEAEGEPPHAEPAAHRGAVTGERRQNGLEVLDRVNVGAVREDRAAAVGKADPHRLPALPAPKERIPLAATTDEG